jgi:hypothetical protein
MMKGDETHLSEAINQSCFSDREEVLDEGIARIRHVSLSAATGPASGAFPCFAQKPLTKKAFCS